MNSSAQFLNRSEAAKRLGVSSKALLLYEERGLIAPIRNAAGWRAYGPAEIARAEEIAALRALGLSLAQVERVFGGSAQIMEPALAAHQAALEGRVRQLVQTVEKVRGLRADLAQGHLPSVGELTRLVQPASEIIATFDLPWPWAGERFDVRDVRGLNYVTGPLGSGKTRLIRRLSETILGAAFLGLDRLENGGAAARARLDDDPTLRVNVDQTLAWLVEEGAKVSDALAVLVMELASEGASILVIDMLEQGLDRPTQEALMAYLRGRGSNGRPLIFTTRSDAILDLAAVGPDEAIILCPANHSQPIRIAPYPGGPGYEAVSTCLASPEARARTEGLIASRAQAA